MKLLTVCVALCIGFISADEYQKKGPRCFDCNYAPSGYVLTQGHYVSKVGYSSCALRTDYDRNHVDKWGCKSGMCFIRKDYNGLVYRGCADEDNLPWGVDPSKNCQYQGPNKSLYYFCKGDLCNEGQLGDSQDRCGALQAPEGQTNTAQPDTVVVNEGYGKMAPNSLGYGIKDDTETYKNILPRLEPGYGYDLCDGICYSNPSGLFAYPEDNKFFIQCDSDVRHSQPCVCCKPTLLPCPYGASFDPDTKVCSKMGHINGY